MQELFHFRYFFVFYNYIITLKLISINTDIRNVILNIFIIVTRKMTT